MWDWGRNLHLCLWLVRPNSNEPLPILCLSAEKSAPGHFEVWMLLRA